MSARIGAGAFVRALNKRGAVALVLAAFALASLAPAAAQPVKGAATLSKPGDYARLVVKLQRQVEAEVRTSGLIVVIKFVRPIDVNVDKLWEGAPEFVSSARVDPDGTAGMELAATVIVTAQDVVLGTTGADADNWLV